MDSRRLNNVIIPETFPEWTNAFYLGDQGKAKGGGGATVRDAMLPCRRRLHMCTVHRHHPPTHAPMPAPIRASLHSGTHMREHRFGGYLLCFK